MEAALRILREIESLLTRYGYDRPAARVKAVIGVAPHEDFWVMASGLEFGGGAGAVWEVEPFNMSHPRDVASVDDYRRFQVLMVELANVLRSRGLDTLAAPTAAYFQRQLGAQ